MNRAVYTLIFLNTVISLTYASWKEKPLFESRAPESLNSAEFKLGSLEFLFDKEAPRVGVKKFSENPLISASHRERERRASGKSTPEKPIDGIPSVNSSRHGSGSFPTKKKKSFCGVGTVLARLEALSARRETVSSGEEVCSEEESSEEVEMSDGAREEDLVFEMDDLTIEEIKKGDNGKAN